MENPFRFAAGVLIVLAVVLFAVAVWRFWACYNPAIYAPILKCLGVLLGWLILAVIAGAGGVLLGQVSK